MKTEHVKPGKRWGIYASRAQRYPNWDQNNERFRASESVERVHMEDKDFQYLYKDDSGYTFMDQETYDQITRFL